MFDNYRDKYSESAIIKKLFRIMGIISSKAFRMIVTFRSNVQLIMNASLKVSYRPQ